MFGDSIFFNKLQAYSFEVKHYLTVNILNCLFQLKMSAKWYDCR